MSGVRRPREPRKPRGTRAPKGVYGRSYKKWMSTESNITIQRTTTGALGLGGSDLEAAAKIIADKAKEIAAGWSSRIPGSIKVEVNGNVATISSDAPPAYPNEIRGVRHPVFGMTGGVDDIRLRRARSSLYDTSRKGHKRSETAHIKGHWVTNQYRPFLGAAVDETGGEAAARYADKVDAMCRARGFDDH